MAVPERLRGEDDMIYRHRARSSKEVTEADAFLCLTIFENARGPQRIDGHKKHEKSAINAEPCVAPIGARTVVAEAQNLFAIFVANRIGLWLRLRRAGFARVGNSPTRP